MTFYRKYRPQTIDELDLTRVREQMKKLSSSIDAMPHAFLFAGPRGAGKTSAARILAKLVNCEKPRKMEDWYEPCNKCSQCKAIMSGQSMDVIELDTASNRGIDDIRALRENISLAPASARKKVYILDEAHMLTLEAANAFLKTLEEPPAHALFILATTDSHKLPETVLSRLTEITFTKATPKEVERQLKRIITNEKLKVEDGVCELISKKVDGSFREAVKIIEVLGLDGDITKKKVEEYYFSTSGLKADVLIDLIIKNNVKDALEEVRKFAEAGGSTRQLIDDMLSVLRGMLLENALNSKDTSAEVALINHLLEAKGKIALSSIPQLPLELAIIQSTKAVSDNSTAKKKAPEPVAQDSASSIDASIWAEILQKTREKNTALEAVLRTAKPIGVDGNTFKLAVYYQFHKERLEAEQYRRMIESSVEEVMGITRAKIDCVLKDPPVKPISEPEISSLTQAPEPDIIQAAKEIFGN